MFDGDAWCFWNMLDYVTTHLCSNNNVVAQVLRRCVFDIFGLVWIISQVSSLKRQCEASEIEDGDGFSDDE